MEEVIEEECKEIEDLPVTVDIVITEFDDINGGSPSITVHDQAEGCNRVDSINAYAPSIRPPLPDEAIDIKDVDVCHFDEELVKKAIMQKPRSLSYVLNSAARFGGERTYNSERQIKLKNSP